MFRQVILALVDGNLIRAKGTADVGDWVYVIEV